MTQLCRIVGFKTVSASRSVNCSLASCCPDGSSWPQLTMKRSLSRFEVENLEVFGTCCQLHCHAKDMSFSPSRYLVCFTEEGRLHRPLGRPGDYVGRISRKTGTASVPISR